MPKFTLALSFLLASSLTVADARINAAEVSKAARSAIKASPVLRLKEIENRRKLESKLVAAAQPKSRSLNDGNQENWYEAYDADMALEDYGFCIDQYSVKYTGCHTAQSYSDLIAADDNVDGVLRNQGYATFRLCPSDQCNSNSKYGCAYNYGEYIVPLSTYMSGLIASEQERLQGFCEFCNTCAGIESAKQFVSEVNSHRETVLAQAETNMQTWIANYEAELAANGNGYYDGNGDYVANEDVELTTTYWNYLRSNANNNANNNQAYGGSGQWWQNQQSMGQFWGAQSSSQASNSASWNSMGSWYGRPVYNGYFGDDGNFYQGWGYFSAYDGAYHFLEAVEGENEQEQDVFFYDPALFGDMPDNWNEAFFQQDEAQEEDQQQMMQSCSSTEITSCNGQYDTCMQILGDGDYQAYLESMYGEGYEAARASNFATCTAVDGSNLQADQAEQAQDQAYANYQSNNVYQQQNYGNVECEEGDEDCEAQQDYNQQMYQQQMQNQQQGQGAAKNYYIGPRCGADGHSIDFAVYSDEYCSTYESDAKVKDILGYNLIDDSSELVPSECISCATEANQWQNNGQEEEQNQVDVSIMCSMLYQVSGKCQRNLKPNCYDDNQQANYQQAECEGEECDQEQEEQNQYQYQQQYNFDEQMQSPQQAANEEMVCGFIDTLQAGTYNENGEIYLGSDAWTKGWTNPANWRQEYTIESQAMSAGRKAAISIAALAVVGMAGYACFLHGSLARKNIPWKPRKTEGEDPMDVVRQNSGIVMGRSRSGPANAPLI